MPEIFTSDHVAMVRELHSEVFDSITSKTSVSFFLTQISQNLFAAHQEGDLAAAVEISYFHPKFIGKPFDLILDEGDFDLDDSQLVTARQFGFSDWETVKTDGNILLDHRFETAADILVGGEINDLREILGEFSYLTGARSAFGHRATLLHYTANNGVEIFRRRVPHNIVDLAHLLVKFGAKKEAHANLRGGRYTSRQLASTSRNIRGLDLFEDLLNALAHGDT